MTCEDEVLKFGRKLSKIAASEDKSVDDAMDILRALSQLPIDLEVLQKTRIGMTVNELRKKVVDEKVASMSKSLIRNWKKLIDEPKQKSAAASGSTAAAEAPRRAQFPAARVGDADVRDKCREMLLNSMRWTDLPDGTHDAEEVATNLEAALFAVHAGSGDKYKAAVRCRVFNLRDKKNPALRENVLTGVLSAERLARMTTEEMAGPDIRQMREKFTKEAINEHQITTETGTPSDMFKCGKCRKTNCSYSQVQTRSADEPMTTFVFCRDCGNRWKFN